MPVFLATRSKQIRFLGQLNTLDGPLMRPDEGSEFGEALRSAAACRRLSASDGEDWRDRRAQGGSKLQHSDDS